MTRRPSTTAAMKLKVLSNEANATFYCAGCGRLYGVDKAEYDHIQPLALGGEHTVENLQALCKDCHKEKTSGTGATTHGSDIGNITKTKRLEKAREALERGEKKKPKKKIQSRGWDKKYKKKMSGEVVERD